MALQLVPFNHVYTDYEFVGDLKKGPGDCSIWHIGAVKTDGSQFEAFINVETNKETHEGCVELTEDYLKEHNATTFMNAFHQFVRWVGPQAIIISHNCFKSDKLVIESECKKHGVSLVGGETAEMPGTYHKNEYDLVGVATGVIERKNIIDGSNVKAGDIAVGVYSNGLHTNGYSLARKLIFDTLKLSTSGILPGHDIPVEECLLAPHMNYSSLIKQVLKRGINIQSISHITGGGLIDNIPRVIPKDVSLEVDIKSWNKIPVFDFLQNNLNIDKKDLYQTFNMGIGLVFIVKESEKDRLVSFIGSDSCSVIGAVVKDGLNAVHLNG